MATPIHPEWAVKVPGCTTSIVGVSGASSEEQWQGVVTHPQITLAGSVYIVDTLSGRRLDAYRLTYAPSPLELLSIRYEAPAAAAVSRVAILGSIATPQTVTAYFTAAATMEGNFLLIYGPPA